MLYVFDSGLGGLTALRELRALLPAADVVYFGDTGRVPYGTRSHETLVRYSEQAMRFLLSNEPDGLRDVVLIACGTVSSGALDELRADFDTPFVGVVEPAAEAAAALSPRKVGVLGTSGTIAAGAYERALRALSDAEIISVACPLFVSVVECGFIGAGDPVAAAAARAYLSPLAGEGVDTLILGCTHFPLIAGAISAELPGARLINSGAEAASRAAELYLRLNPSLASRTGSGDARYFVSDKPRDFTRTAELFLGHALETPATVVDIEKY